MGPHFENRGDLNNDGYVVTNLDEHALCWRVVWDPELRGLGWLAGFGWNADSKPQAIVLRPK